jgi:hypothetical protein
MERLAKEVNDITVLNAYKLFLRNAAQTLILLTLCTIVEKFNLNRCPWFYKLTLRAVV